MNKKKLSRETTRLLAEGYEESAEEDLAIAKDFEAAENELIKTATSRIDIATEIGKLTLLICVRESLVKLLASRGYQSSFGNYPCGKRQRPRYNGIRPLIELF